ncbi:hypothetical protein WJX84_009938 [Apatococcus fuscideae]|uniref:Methyltransferase FkbM domain-containing protein n=1 Tax=Apatococcus fuscideae TaxID=2026836 RepID=A0AAW1T3W4_9CHLO
MKGHTDRRLSDLVSLFAVAICLLLPLVCVSASSEGPRGHRATSLQSAAIYKAARLQARLQQEEKDNWDWFEQQKANFPIFRPTAEDKLVFDVGLYDGADTQWFLQQGFHVVGVDANPKFVQAAKERFAEHVEAGKLVLLNAGLDEESGKNMTFYVAKYLPHSSFEFEKACYTDCQPLDIPVRQCQGLFAFGRPLYLKIDIEERHYVCVQALQYLQPELLPKIQRDQGLRE